MLQKRWLYLSLVALLLAVGGFWYYSGYTSGPIQPYNAARDRAFILDQFKKDWYWLISDYSPDYDVEFMLDRKSPVTDDPKYTGTLIIKTYVVDGAPAGFVAYYEKELKIGQLLFLSIGEQYRRKGIGRKLMNYANNDFKRRGIRAIRMNTRADNKKARQLYENIGYKQIWTDGAYIIYEIIL